MFIKPTTFFTSLSTLLLFSPPAFASRQPIRRRHHELAERQRRGIEISLQTPNGSPTSIDGSLSTSSVTAITSSPNAVNDPVSTVTQSISTVYASSSPSSSPAVKSSRSPGFASSAVSASSIPVTSAANSSNGNATSPSIISSTATSTVSTSDTSSSVSPTPTYTPDLSLIFDPPANNPKINLKSYKELSSKIDEDLKNANEITKNSWEIGCFAETILEVYNPNLTPFEWECKNQLDPNYCDEEQIPWSVLKIAENSLVAYNWTNSPSSSSDALSWLDKVWNTDDEEEENDWKKYLDNSTSPTKHQPQPFLDGAGALGDPVSLIPAIYVLAKYANNALVQDKIKPKKTSQDYAWALGNQLDYLLAGSTSPINKTISQREGLSTSNKNLLSKGLEQWSLESSALLDTTVNIHRHVNDWDARLWATGNGWALYGAIRNLYAVKASGFSSKFSNEVEQVENTLEKVFTGLFNELDDDNLIPNYMRQANETLAVGDTAGTALTVAAYYRYINICPSKKDDKLLQSAEKAFDSVVDKIDNNGWVLHEVDPQGTYGWVVYPDDKSFHSPEAQAFVATMWKARTDAGC
ncbi:uncharacterized protein L201_006758 [Kwoniella dendrophila CBS 6074]|uniref:Alginate lyase domain-containing protein n=1 Tax=Kwoniella dendrophila CBS 6074 TaxID=1295534 RepID=A0AAX4K282_9TREE